MVRIDSKKFPCQNGLFVVNLFRRIVREGVGKPTPSVCSKREGLIGLVKERIETVVERLGDKVAADLGYELVEVEYCKEGPDWVLRCTIDKESGIGIDDCQRFSESLERVLDETDPIPGKYLLEVSSPGIERPLKKAADFSRFAGRMVEVKLVKAVNNQKTYRGVLLGISGDGSEQKVRLKVNDSNIIEIPRNEIAKAKLMSDISDIFGGEGGKKRK